MPKRIPDEFKTCVVCAKPFTRRKKSGGLLHAPRWAIKVTCCNKCHIVHSWAKRKEPVEDRFWRQVERRGPQDCWIWVGGYRDPKKGYGGFHYEGRRMVRAHRMAYIFAYREISQDVVVRHKCDNAPCCNPLHLETGTVADNNRDRDTRGRHVALTRSENPRTKVTVDKLKEMQAKYRALPLSPNGKRKKSGTVQALANEYGIALSTCCRLVTV